MEFKDLEIDVKYRLKCEPSDWLTVKSIGPEFLLTEDEGKRRFQYPTKQFLDLYEPLPSPESPVVQDDVIWEEGDFRLSLSRGAEFQYSEGWSPSINNGLCGLGKFALGLYNRLNPTLPPLPDGEWERVEIPGSNHVEDDDLVLSVGPHQIWAPASSATSKVFAAGRGWVMRRVTALEEWPKIGETYYLAMPTNRDYCSHLDWCGDSGDRMWKERGLIFKTEEEAVAVGQAMAEAAKKMVEGVGK